MIPGSSSLPKVQQLIIPTTIVFFQWVDRIKNEQRKYVNRFADGVTIRANVQPVPRKLYQRMGLDYNKRYVMVWASQNFEDLARNRAPDEMEWEGRRYTFQNEEDWSPIDNWNAVLAVDVGPATS